MGRGRAKGKKATAANQDDPGSGEEEKIPAQKKRGRPQKPLKDEIDEDQVHKVEDDDSEDDNKDKGKDVKHEVASQNGKKRKRNSQVESVKEENGNGTKEELNSNSNSNSNICNGIRPNRSRRKNTPRRAPEAVVECN